MKESISSFVVGVIFATGLGLAGMTLPERVVGFLDVFGDWDPSLLFVMAGALIVHGILYRVIRRRQSPLFTTKWFVPNRRDITPALLLGAALFGVGWGLAGFCPAPAVTALASLRLEPFIFVISMVSGMLLFRIVQDHLPWKS